MLLHNVVEKVICTHTFQLYYYGYDAYANL